MLDQLKLFIEKVKEQNNRCPRYLRCCAILITLPAVLLGLLFVQVAIGLKYIETRLVALLKFIWK